MAKECKVVAVIPARGGSKGLPDKNIRSLNGKPLIGYAIASAKSCQLIDRTIVSTDSERIAKVSRQQGAEVPFLRPQDISDDLATTESVLQHAVLWLDKHEGYHADIVVFLTCTAIFRRDEWIEQVVSKLIEDKSLDSVFMAHKTHKNFWRKTADSWVRLAPDIAYASRQLREPLYREETPSALATRADIIRQGRRIGPRVDILSVDDERITFDIHSEFDFWLAEKVLAEWPMTREIS